jgi:hypothetical protein
LGGITVGAAVILFVWMRGREAPAVEFDGLPFEVKPGTADYSLGSDFGNDVIISPDGTRIVFVVLGSDHVPRLMTLRLDAAAIGGRRVLAPGPGTAVRLPDADGARAPFFSPDGRWVGFWDHADAKLKMVSVEGGSAIVLADAVSFGGASWGDNGYIIAAIDDVLRRVSSSPPGESSVVADLRKNHVHWPDLLPGDTQVLFTAVGPQGPDASNIEVLSLAENERKALVPAGFGRTEGGLQGMAGLPPGLRHKETRCTRADANRTERTEVMANRTA